MLSAVTVRTLQVMFAFGVEMLVTWPPGWAPDIIAVSIAAALFIWPFGRPFGLNSASGARFLTPRSLV
jgi:hypothetical protein